MKNQTLTQVRINKIIREGGKISQAQKGLKEIQQTQNYEQARQTLNLAPPNPTKEQIIDAYNWRIVTLNPLNNDSLTLEQRQELRKQTKQAYDFLINNPKVSQGQLEDSVLAANLPVPVKHQPLPQVPEEGSYEFYFRAFETLKTKLREGNLSRKELYTNIFGFSPPTEVEIKKMMVVKSRLPLNEEYHVKIIEPKDFWETPPQCCINAYGAARDSRAFEKLEFWALKKDPLLIGKILDGLNVPIFRWG